MWNASVNAICDLAHGTGFTASSDVVVASIRSLKPMSEAAYIVRCGR